MSHRGIWDGDEITVLLYQNQQDIGQIVIHAISHAEITAQVFTDDENTLISVYEALKAALSSVEYHMARPRLRELIEDRMREVRESIEDEGEGNPPPPSTDDVPF
jgi:signal transduction histidine kinase